MQTSNSSNAMNGWFTKLFILAAVMIPVLIVHIVTGAGFWMSVLGALFAAALLGGAILTFIMFMGGGK